MLAGKRILPVDEVFTTGPRFHTVGKFLIETGEAKEVRGLVLACIGDQILVGFEPSGDEPAEDDAPALRTAVVAVRG
ncbi:hypothetical protein [Kitasatospora sp. NPDC096204]|uniref:hypothetical protein n=1 Tax=Kitasatospora sp. NPDC096204 TaxID=3364094 RepID=UPI00382A0078